MMSIRYDLYTTFDNCIDLCDIYKVLPLYYVVIDLSGCHTK